MGRRIKSPKTDSRLKALESSSISPEQRSPHFSLEFLDNSYCVSSCEQREKADFAETLRKLSQLTWAELKQTGRHALGYEKISRSSLRVAVPTRIKDDVNFIVFRFSGMKAMIGYRDGHVFYVIWLDRNFSVYQH